MAKVTGYDRGWVRVGVGGWAEIKLHLHSRCRNVKSFLRQKCITLRKIRVACIDFHQSD